MKPRMTPWHGGVKPPDDLLVGQQAMIKVRCGNVALAKYPLTWDWVHLNNEVDIVAYLPEPKGE